MQSPSGVDSLEERKKSSKTLREFVHETLTPPSAVFDFFNYDFFLSNDEGLRIFYNKISKGGVRGEARYGVKLTQDVNYTFRCGTGKKSR